MPPTIAITESIPSVPIATLGPRHLATARSTRANDERTEEDVDSLSPQPAVIRCSSIEISYEAINYLPHSNDCQSGFGWGRTEMHAERECLRGHMRSADLRFH